MHVEKILIIILVCFMFTAFFGLLVYQQIATDDLFRWEKVEILKGASEITTVYRHIETGSLKYRVDPVPFLQDDIDYLLGNE
jgi:hypothetical protein